MKNNHAKTYRQLKHLPQTKNESNVNEEDSGEGEGWHQVTAPSHLRTPSSSSSQQEGPAFTTNTRIILEELVLVTNYLPEFLSPEITARPCYFGKYGKVVKTIFTQKFFQKKVSHLAFITYQNHLDAALAIVALQPFSHNCFKCTTTYGTSRYCPSFIGGVKCTFKDCYFMHSIQPNSITVQEIREMPHAAKIKPALDKIRKNLNYYIEREYDEFISSKIKKKNNGLVMCQCQCQNQGQVIVFPGVRDTMARLVRDGSIDKGQYERLKNNYKEKIREKNANIKAQQDKKIKAEQFDSLLSTPCSSSKSQASKKSALSLSKTQDRSEDEFMPSLIKKLTYESDPIPLRQYQPKKEEVPKAESQMKGREKKGKSKTLMEPKCQNTDPCDAFISMGSQESRQFYFRSPPMGRQSLQMYEKLMPTQKALSCYIHHKILQQANYYQPALLILSPQRYDKEESTKLKSNLMRHLTEY